MINWLDPHNPQAPFPSVESALTDPDGLLAAGGDLSSERILQAYHQGIFPWYEEGQPILWWSPNPRAVLYPDRLHISRSLRKTLRNRLWSVSFDHAFHQTIMACTVPRRSGGGTWITRDMQEAYCRLHAQGYAHSVEVWNETGALIGGLYGIAIDRIFFGESMFSNTADSSKVAMAYLARHLQKWNFHLIDCQVPSLHVSSLGAELLPRRRFIMALDEYCHLDKCRSAWKVDDALEIVNWKPSETK